jgi:hypothetical protein
MKHLNQLLAALGLPFVNDEVLVERIVFDSRPLKEVLRMDIIT